MTLNAKPHNDQWIIQGSETVEQGGDISVNERVQYWTGAEWHDDPDRAMKVGSEEKANEYIDKYPHELKRYSA